MRHYGFRVLLMVLITMPLGAQAPTDEPMRIGPGVTPPRLTYKIEPEYSAEARANHVQGTVVLQIIVDDKGRATDISVVSPLGFGLEEAAQAAVAKWEFAPGMNAGRPARILATVEVNFRFRGIWFDEKTERQRTAFNVALQNLNQARASQAAVDRAVKSVTDLSRLKFAPAMHLAGLWMMRGEHGRTDIAAGFDLIQKAATKNYGPALYELAMHRIEGRDLARDSDKGLLEMREAATLGSRQAQLYLASRYERGDAVPQELDRARRYYRLCGAQGVALCQYRLGRLLYNEKDRPERDYLQAIAFFQLAAEQGLPEAQQLASQEAPNLTAEQTTWVAKLKRQIVQK